MSLDVRTGHARSERGSEAYVVAALNLPLERLGSVSLRSPTSAAIAREEARRSAAPRGSQALQEPSVAPPSAAPLESSSPSPAAREPAPPSAAAPSASAAPSSPGAGLPKRAPAEPNRRQEDGGGSGARSQSTERELPGELVDEVLRRAEHSSGVVGIEERIGSLARRSRTSGLVPELRVRGMHGIDQTTSLGSTGVYPGDTTVRDGLDALVEVRLTFELDRLVFGSEEPGLVRQLAEARKQRERLEGEVTDLLLDWFEAYERLTRHRSGQVAMPRSSVDDGSAAPPHDPALDEGSWGGGLDDESLDPDERARQREKDKITLRRSEVHLRRLTRGWFRGAATLAAYEP